MAGEFSAVKTVAVVTMVVLSTFAGFVTVPAAAAAGNTAPNCSTVSYTGDGTLASPYQVSNVDQLQCMDEDHADASDKADALSSHYELVSDIDASGTEHWNGGKGFDPIGDCGNGHSHLYNNCGVSSSPFTGTFDGQSYQISNLTIDRANGVAVGLFGLAEGAQLSNIRLESVSVTGEENVGGLVGHMQKDGSGYPVGNIENVSVRGNVTWSGVNDEAASGGKFGGIVGLAANTPLDNENVFVGNVTGQYNVGGLVGRMAWSTTIGNSYARGTVRSTATSDTAECGGNGNCEAGGLAGNSGNPSDITNAYAAVTVDAPTAGAIIGDDNGQDTLTNVYWDEDVGPSVASSGSIDDASSGEYTGLSTSEMQGSSAEANMNFDWTNAWQTVASDYPVFQWEADAVENPTTHSIEASDVTVDEDVQDTIAVTATDEFGNGVDGETITVEADTDGLDGVSVGDTATTDSNGETTFTFTEATPGQYTVEFSADGGSVTDTATVTVNDVTDPNADASNSPTTGNEGESITFDGTASTDNGDIASYEWDWTNDGSYDDTGVTTAHTYSDTGTYTVKLRVTDDAGNTDTTTHSVTVAAAEDSLPIDENFDGAEPADWELRHDASWGTTHDGESTLHLTAASGDEKGLAFYDKSFSSRDGIVAEFDYYAHEGDGADGIAFFLVDGDKVSSSTTNIIGADGGSLGYAQGDKDSSGTIDNADEEGVPHAYIGVGFDEFGNFASDGECKDGGVGQTADSVTVRGKGNGGSCNSGYAHLQTNGVSGQGGIDGGWRSARITVTPKDTDDDGTADETDLRVEMSWDDGNSWTRVITYTYTETPPTNLKLGFSGSTGGSTNVHAIDDLSVTKPVDLSTTITSAPNDDPYHAGDTVEYVFDVTNNGPNDDGSVSLGTTGLTTGESGMKNLQWDTDNDGSYDDDTGASTTVSLTDGHTKTVSLRGTVGDDATGSLDHDITASSSSNFNDPDPSNNDASVSIDLNAAPSFTGSESLANIDEDVSPASNGGAEIDSNELFGDEFSDSDGDAFAGIVVTNDAADSSTEGTWQYSTDGGTNWYDVDDGSLSAGDGLLLSSTSKIRFDPVEDYNGNPGDLTVFAVDDSGSTAFTSGSTRKTYDTTSTGKSSVVAENGNTVGITVDAVEDPPIANAGDERTVDEDTQVNFDGTASSDPDSNIATYEWDWTNDGSYDDTGTTSAHTYADPGTYTVKLRVTDGAGNTDTDTVTITVNDVTGPTADAGNDQTVDEDTQVNFDGSGSTDNGNIASYAWDFDGDGSTDATDIHPTHTFADPGTHDVDLTVTDDEGNTDTDTVTITVSDVTDPTADAGSNVSVKKADEVSFNASGSADNVGIASYAWDFGDGETATGEAVTHEYDSTGEFTVELTVTDGSGNTDTDTLTVDVSRRTTIEDRDESPPVADAGDDVAVESGETVEFDASGSSDDLGIAKYVWDLDGDDVTDAMGVTTSQRFREPGVHVVTLTVTDEAGKTATDNVTVTVDLSQGPVADAGDDRADEGAIVFAAPPGKNTDELRFGDGNGTTVELGEAAKTIGPATVDFDGDGLVEVPYVAHSGRSAGNLRLIDGEGETTTLVDQGRNYDGTDVAQSRTVQAVGTWNGSAASVFYVDKSKTTIYRVALGENPTEIIAPEDGASAVLGVTDIDDDGLRELVFLDGSHTIRYLNVDDSIDSTGVTVGGDDGIGAGAPADFDGDGVERVPIVTTDGDLALVDANGQTTLTDGGPAAKASPAAADLDHDGELELVFVGPPNDRDVQYVDDVGGNDTVRSGPDYAADDGVGLMPSATGAAADRTVETGIEVSFDGGNSTADGAIETYEWDVDGDGETDATGETITHTYDRAGTYTVRLTVTDDDGRMDTDTYTVVVKMPESEIDAGLAPIPAYHGNLANTGHYVGETGPHSKPTILWEKSVDGPIAIQPVVSDETVFVGVHDPGPLSAFDKQTGEERWRFETEKRYAGFTWAAPTVVDGTVYVGSNSHHLYALDEETGEVRWKYETRANVRSAPAVADGVVYFGSNRGRMNAVDAETGEEVWTYALDRPHLLESNPTIVDGVVYFGGGDHRIHAVDAETGEEIWTFETHGDVRSDPTVVDGTVFIGSAQSEDSYQEGMVYALDATDGTEQWSYTTNGHVDAGQAYAGGVVYAASRGGEFVALDADDGSVVWEQAGEDFYGAPIVADGVVYVNDFRTATVHAFDADTGEELWQFDSPAPHLYGTPVVDDSVLYYGGNGRFYAIGQPTISLSGVNVTNPADQDVRIEVESNLPVESIEATITGPESATLAASDFEERTDGGSYSYTATYEGSAYGAYNVSVEVTGPENGTDSGEDGVRIPEPTELTTSDETATYTTGDDPAVVDPDLEIAGSEDETIEGAKVIVDAGFHHGDRLDFDRRVAAERGLVGTYDRRKGILTFSGDASPSDYEAVLRTVTFETEIDDGPTIEERQISFSVGGRASYSAATGHYYEYVDESDLTWREARDVAGERSYFGMEGYLVTVTSVEENTFVGEKIDGQSWMGATDADAEGTWRWVTGPEGLEADGQGRHFFTQTASVNGQPRSVYSGARSGGGISVAGAYANWAGGEPNHWYGGENYAHFYPDGSWNDYANDNRRVQGFVVEYGGMPDDRDLSLSDTTTVTVVDEDETPPTADAGGDVSVREGTAVVLDGSGSTDDVGVHAYEWDLDDGGTDNGSVITHVYDEPGTYEVTLTVADEAGNADDDSVTVTVREVTLSAKIGLEETTVDAGEIVTFDGTASDSSEGIDAYAWDVDGDGEADATRPIQRASYETPGEYTVVLTVTDSLGNTAETEATVMVTDSTPPDADAGESRRTVDEGESITFDAGASTDNGVIQEYRWDLDGDGETDATGETVRHAFDDPGTYEVTVTVVDEGGNEGTDTQTVEVRDVTDPVADAGGDVVVGQGEAAIVDAGGSSDNAGIVQFAWDIDGDGAIDRTGERIEVSYDAPDAYAITLRTTDAAGNVDRDTVNVTVLDTEAPTAIVATEDATAELGASVRFNGSTSTDNVGIHTYKWDFGDGTTRQSTVGFGGDALAVITHTYESDGEFEVTLTAVDQEGNADAATVNVTVLNTSVLVASAGATNTSVGAGEPLTLDASASEASAGIDAYAWDLDGDGETDATGETHEVIFDEPGNQTVRLAVTDRAGNEATTDLNVTVEDVTPPTAVTGADERSVDEDDSVTYDANGSTDDVGIETYEWDFTGDGEIDATGETPTYTYGTPGEYTAVLTVTDGNGNTDVATLTVIVADVTPPQVVVDGPDTAAQGEDVQLDAGRTVDNVGVDSYAWDVDGDGQADFSGEQITTSFDEIGTHDVTVSAIDEAGNSHTVPVEIEVTDGIAPVADAGGVLSALEGTSIDFDAGNSTDNVGVTAYEWDFGDGTTDSGETATHTYEHDGRYTITLTVGDAAGNEASDTLRVTVVNGSTLIANAGPGRIQTGQDETIEFDATTSEGETPLESYEWDFDGDGETDATGPMPSHAYEEAGTETVLLTVTDSMGNVATDSVTVDVADTTGPSARAGVSDSTVDEGTAVAFYGTDSSDNTAVDEYRWDFDGDGAVDDTGATTTHTFDEPGSHTVGLTVVDTGGNTANDTVRVFVLDVTAPEVDAGADVDIDVESTVSFEARATDNVEVTRYEWDLIGNGEIDADGESATFTPDAAGEYTVELTVRDAAGNTATDTVAVAVVDDSILAADAGPDRTIGPATEIEFDGTDSEASAGIASYEWDFGDGTADARAVTRHAYVERGTYDVTLTVTDTMGNTVTDTATIRVRDVSDPSADAGDDRTVRIGREVVLTAADTHDDQGIVTYWWNMGDGNVVTTGQPAIGYWYDDPGTYPVTLTVVDPAGNTATDVVLVEVVDEVEAEPRVVTVGTSETEDAVDTAPDTNLTSGEAVRISVREQRTGNARGPALAVDNRAITVENAPDDSSLSLQMNGRADENASAERVGNVVSDRLDLDVRVGGDFDLVVETREIDLRAVTAAANETTREQTVPVDGANESGHDLNVTGVDRRTVDMTVGALSADGQQFVNATGARPAGYIKVDHSISDRDIDGATHHFRVRKSYLNATGVGPEAVQLYRDEPAGWNDLDTRFAGASEEFYHYTADSPGLSLFTIGAHTPVFEILDASVVGGEVVVGEEFTVTVTVANVGNANGTYVTHLVADGEIVDTQTVDVSSDATRVVRVSHTFEEPGEHSLAIGNLALETVEVNEGTPERPEFAVQDAQLVDETVTVGEEIIVTATIANNGSIGGTYTAQLLADGEVVATQAVELSSGDSRTVDLTHTFDDVGEHTLAIGDYGLQTVVVEEAAPSHDRWLLGGLAVAGVLFIVFFWRRRDDDSETAEDASSDDREDRARADSGDASAADDAAGAPGDGDGGIHADDGTENRSEQRVSDGEPE